MARLSVAGPAAILLMLAARLTLVQSDVENGKDHPLVGRSAGSINTSTAAPPAELEAEVRAIQQLTGAIRRADARIRDLRRQIDDVALELQRPGVRATGAVPGWQRALTDLRAEVAKLRQRRAALRVDSLNAEPRDGASAQALRTYHDLERRLPQLEEALGDASQSLDHLRARMREPEPSRTPGNLDVPPFMSAQAGTVNLNLSGAWRRGDEIWQVRQDPNGTIVLEKPHALSDGRSDEYRGTMRGLTVTLLHPVTALTSVSKEVPAKVKQERAGKGLTSTLTLQLSPDGRRLEGDYQHHTIEYDANTLKIVKITPKTDSVVLTRKAPDDGSLPEEGATRQVPSQDRPTDREVAELWRLAARQKDIAVDQRHEWLEWARLADEAEALAAGAMTRVAQIEALERTTYLERRRGQGTQEVGARVDSRAAREELTNLMRSAERLREMAQTAKKWYYVERDEAVRARNAALDAARRARTPRGGGASAPVRKQPER